MCFMFLCFVAGVDVAIEVHVVANDRYADVFLVLVTIDGADAIVVDDEVSADAYDVAADDVVAR